MRVMFCRRQRERRLDVFFPAKKAQDVRRVVVDYAPPPSAHFQLFGGKKRFLLSKLNAITCLTITSKWSVAMMAVSLSLNKYPALCKPKSLGAS
jgi:hypothetical protein